MQFEFHVYFEEQFTNTCLPLTSISKFAKKKNKSKSINSVYDLHIESSVKQVLPVSMFAKNNVYTLNKLFKLLN